MSAPYSREQQERILRALQAASVTWPGTAEDRRVALERLWQLAAGFAGLAALPGPPSGAAYRDIAGAVSKQASELRSNVAALFLAAPARHSGEEAMVARWQRLMGELDLLAADASRLALRVGDAIPAKRPADHDRKRLADWMLLEWLEEHFGKRGTVINPDPAKGGNRRSDVLEFLKAATEPLFGPRGDGEVLGSIRARNAKGFSSALDAVRGGRTNSLRQPQR